MKVVSSGQHGYFRRIDVSGHQAWLLSADPVTVISPDEARAAAASFGRQPEMALMPLASRPHSWLVNDTVIDLLGLPRSEEATADVSRIVQRAVGKNLICVPPAIVAARRDDSESEATAVALPEPLSIGFDATWLLGSESGTQVFANRLIRGLAGRSDVAAITCFSDSGRLPPGLENLDKVSASSWAPRQAAQRVDILHRPYQPDASTRFDRYRAVAQLVAVTVLDLIAYDNPTYHDSWLAWHAHRLAFENGIRQSDAVFAISAYIAAQVQHRLRQHVRGSVQATVLGTDHLAGGTAGTQIAALANSSYVLILGNDFEHKNRDFGVKVFNGACLRGYQGRLVLAGFHLDRGSSFARELDGAPAFAERVLRLPAVSHEEKLWLLANADVVLYPTSAEGFGLIPFEAAACGRPTAFVRFGPLKETMPEVEAAGGWRIAEFTDLVLKLSAEPEAQVAAIRAAGAALTWQQCVDATVAGYRRMLQSPGRQWQVRVTSPPRTAAVTTLLMMHRVGQRLRRLKSGSP